jgi:hypothetical protein
MSVYSLKRVSDKWVERMLAYLPWVFTLKNKGAPREKKEIERKPSTDFEILLMTDG